jgi:hypothetical protein
MQWFLLHSAGTTAAEEPMGCIASLALFGSSKFICHRDEWIAVENHILSSGSTPYLIADAVKR